MPISMAQFDALSGPENSWAIWDERFPEKGCLCDEPLTLADRLFLPNIAALKTDVIFLALNPSAEVTLPWSCFHYPRSIYPRTNDGRIKANVQDRGLTSLVGAFMTDLFPLKEEADSSKLKPTTDDRMAAKKSFVSKLSVLTSEGENIKVICFGGACFREFGRVFRQERVRKTTRLMTEASDRIDYGLFEIEKRRVHLFRIMFYGNLWGQRYYEVLERQLTHLDKVFRVADLGLENTWLESKASGGGERCAGRQFRST